MTEKGFNFLGKILSAPAILTKTAVLWAHLKSKAPGVPCPSPPPLEVPRGKVPGSSNYRTLWSPLNSLCEQKWVYSCAKPLGDSIPLLHHHIITSTPPCLIIREETNKRGGGGAGGGTSIAKPPLVSGFVFVYSGLEVSEGVKIKWVDRCS